MVLEFLIENAIALFALLVSGMTFFLNFRKFRIDRRDKALDVLKGNAIEYSEKQAELKYLRGHLIELITDESDQNLRVELKEFLELVDEELTVCEDELKDINDEMQSDLSTNDLLFRSRDNSISLKGHMIEMNKTIEKLNEYIEEYLEKAQD